MSAVPRATSGECETMTMPNLSALIAKPLPFSSSRRKPGSIELYPTGRCWSREKNLVGPGFRRGDGLRISSLALQSVANSGDQQFARTRARIHMADRALAQKGRPPLDRLHRHGRLGPRMGKLAHA